jgi:hypothetical protein
MFNGFMQFTIGAGNEKGSVFGSPTTGAAKDENSVIFTRGALAAFRSCGKRSNRQLRNEAGL